MLGRHAFQRLSPPGQFDNRFLDVRTGTDFVVSPFGLRGGRPDFYDLSLGGRVDLWGETVIGFANVIVPLNDDGFRSDAIPLVGVEVAF